MATAAKPPKDKVQNWVKGAVALFHTKEGLEEFVLSEIKDFQTDLLKAINKSIGNTSQVACNSCTTANILRCPTIGFCTKGGRCKIHDPKDPLLTPDVPCKRKICQAIRGHIRKQHRYYVSAKSEPSWKNADATQFCSDPFHLAKCYMSTDGYSDVKSMKDTDFNGVINIVLNNKRFQNKMSAKLSQKSNICTEARDIGREIRHSPNLSVSDAEITKYIDTLIDLLSDPKYLAVDRKAQAAVVELQMLKVNRVSLDDEKLKQIIEDAIQESIHSKTELVKEDIAVHAVKERDNMLKMLNEAIRDLVKTETKASLKQITSISKDAMTEILKSGSKVVQKTAEKEKDLVKLETKNSLNQIASTSKDIVKEISIAGSKIVQEIAETKKHALQDNHTPTKDKHAELEDDVIRKGHQSIVISLPEHVEAEIYVSPKAGKETDFDMLRLKEDFREDLVVYYKENCSTVPISPLMEEHDVLLSNLYVSQKIVSIDVVKIFNESQEPPNETPIKSYNDMLFSGSEPNKNIYVTGRDGVGKTSFVKNLCMMWCQAHVPKLEANTRVKKENLEAVRKFDFLFLIFLRETNADDRDVDDMIDSQILRRLSRHINYSRQFLTNVLHNTVCLIVLDGLDEWPDCKRIPIPQRKSRQNCTILTTSRPWKFDNLKLGVNQIDMHLKLCEFDEHKAALLIENAVPLLNKRSNHSKSTEDFKNLLAKIKHDRLLFTPFILMQFIGLWFDGKSIGNSKSELYTNFVDLILTRGIRKIGNFHSVIQTLTQTRQFPACFRTTEECKMKYALLLRIGRLAFETLFGEGKESCLLFGKGTITKYITEKQLETCVSLGILAQNKTFGNVSFRKGNFSFQHKSIQEYFAALYIQANPDDVEVKRKMNSKCNTLPAVLEMSSVFVFVSGFNQSAASEILSETLTVLSKDEIAQKYRSGSSLLRSSFMNAKAIKSIQNMVVYCSQESMNNGQNDIQFLIEDIAIDANSEKDDNLTVLNTLLELDRRKLKSFSLKECVSANEANGILQKLNTKKICHLRKLELRSIPVTQVLQPLLKENKSTLECLDLCSLEFDKHTHEYYYKIVKLSSEHIQSILNMDCLQVLTLGSVRLDHADLGRLLNFLIRKISMRQIVLYRIECSDHRNTCGGFILDLSCHKCLHVMGLDSIPLSKFCLDPISLEECWVGKLAPEYLSYVFELLQSSGKLHTLYCLQLDNLEAMMKSVPNLGQLKYVCFQQIDFGNRVISLASKSKTSKIEIISFKGTKLSSTALRLLVDSIENIPHEVDICLEHCKVTPVEDYEEIKSLLRSSENFTVTFDGLNKRKEHVFNCGTIKTDSRSTGRRLSETTLVTHSARL